MSDQGTRPIVERVQTDHADVELKVHMPGHEHGPSAVSIMALLLALGAFIMAALALAGVS